MPKKIKKCFNKNLTFEKFMQAHKRARTHKTLKKEIIKFEFNLENNIINLIKNIKNHTYKLGKYHEFKVYDPKERIIKALPYIDRIVHQWYVEEFIKPYILPKLIDNTFACIPERGTHKAVLKTQKNMRKFKKNNPRFWILKCDIKKYINDKELLDFTKILIFNNLEEKIGIPIGNYTSQFFANIYLNELDQFIKRKLKIEYYCRYMDDFILLLKTKQECINIKKEIEEFLKNNLHLKLNEKSKYFPYEMGIDFCGYRIFTTHKLLRTSNKKKIKNEVKKLNNLYKRKCLNINYAMQSINSWMGHCSHCNSYKLKNKIINSCEFIYKE